MTRVPSLTRRVVVGAVLWSLGLLLVASAVLAAAIEQHRASAAAVHAALAHTPVVATLALVLLAAGVYQVRGGLSSVGRLRARLGDVRRGDRTRVDGDYPAEVQPLVDDLNALLERRDQAIRRAQDRAGDLAHGLKTPLAVIAQEVARSAHHGPGELATILDEQIARMSRQIDYHLAHARATASSGVGSVGLATPLGEAVAVLARTLARLHAARGLTFDLDVPDGVVARCQREDLDEMVGNLMDNACKWASSRVRVTTSESASGLITLTVEDDGAGLADGAATEALRRGRRLDEGVPGWGLGLAIVGDLASMYGGRLTLETSPLGGVAARLQLPSGR